MTQAIGLTLPVKKTTGGWFAPKELRDLVKSSIAMILGTRPGERVCEPDYGSRVRELVFESSDQVFVALANQYVVDAIRRWERRITLVDVKVLLPADGSSAAAGLTPNQAKISLRYVVNAQSVEDNLDLVLNRGL